MIIDLILDRKDNEADIAKGITHYHLPNGKLIPIKYDAHKFYMSVMKYGWIGWDITRAMDSGTEEDVQRALCEYIKANDYNPEICNYVKAVKWLS